MVRKLLIELFEWSPTEHIDPFHTHDHLEIGYCLSGTGTFYFGNKTYSVQQNDVFVVNNLEWHAASSHPDNPSNYLFIYFDAMIIEQVDPELLLPFVYWPKRFDNRVSGRLPVARQIGDLFQEMWDEYRNKERGYQGIMHSKILEICALLLRHYDSQTSLREGNQALMSYYRLKPVLDYMKEHFREPITLEGVASMLSLSPSRARHLFAEKLGGGFKQYLLQLRVNEAKRLLVSTEMPIIDIMHHCGFQSHAPFYRAFKLIVGMAPQQYRELGAKIALFKNH
ncbi:AraC family transcriptional regulator [Paenibacillus apiarius]|uniref:AraC family transcriptional regulator n=1 Tax=Paenibacillus apiarius TaxID=46240 RepID=A0ABT4DU61_9BACL|nr:AraC family transcriptional regulator [Paenibacillus apiarius]MCY9515982.1 AraC family transcriptional regulator [Paenibacillus apiarius]MCY9520892.1 AraC family transcriptional regulator [Paenibacillus apiarius]MCY9553597.1 AraC family transcriptional regulator [Paenibacillus apiarius]MCY9557880.1 AraC family transcriptional regulator [Paenibacillus apiarius]MCY9685735.1 AraC family transcriptional regulator [Paenibacillus apiarius]